MSYMIIEVEILIGAELMGVLKEAKEKAASLDVAYIKFSFNNKTFTIGRHTDIEEAARRYSEERDRMCCP